MKKKKKDFTSFGMQHFTGPFLLAYLFMMILSVYYYHNMFSFLPCQARGGAPPANELQSQLNDMLDDSASDNSSTLQTREGPSSPLPPAPPTLGDGLQNRASNLNLGPKNAKLQQMLSISASSEMDTHDMQMVGQESIQQQTSQVSDQLQVSVMIMTETHPLPLHFMAVPQSRSSQ